MKVDDSFSGHLGWKHGARQHIITEGGETKQDAIRFMHEQLKYFGYQDDLTFDESEIEQSGDDEFIFKIRGKFNPNRKNELPPPPPLRMKIP